MGEHRWQRTYVELYRDGQLKLYENAHSPNAEETISLGSECLGIQPGSWDNPNLKPPGCLPITCLFSLAGTSGKVWTFCADTPNESRSWIVLLEETRLTIATSLFHPSTAAAYVAAAAAAAAAVTDPMVYCNLSPSTALQQTSIAFPHSDPLHKLMHSNLINQNGYDHNANHWTASAGRSIPDQVQNATLSSVTNSHPNLNAFNQFNFSNFLINYSQPGNSLFFKSDQNTNELTKK